MYNDVTHKNMKIALILQVTSYKIYSFVPMLFCICFFFNTGQSGHACILAMKLVAFMLLRERASRVQFCRTFIPVISLLLELAALN